MALASLLLILCVALRESIDQGGLDEIPHLQSDEEFDADFVKDDNNDDGSYDAYSGVDELKVKLAKQQAAERRNKESLEEEREAVEEDDAKLEKELHRPSFLKNGIPGDVQLAASNKSLIPKASIEELEQELDAEQRYRKMLQDYKNSTKLSIENAEKAAEKAENSIGESIKEKLKKATAKWAKARKAETKNLEEVKSFEIKKADAATRAKTKAKEYKEGKREFKEAEKKLKQFRKGADYLKLLHASEQRPTRSRPVHSGSHCWQVGSFALDRKSVV